MSDYLISGIGKKLRTVRMERKIKLTVLANKAGVSKGLLSKIENGRTVPSLPVLLTLIKCLDLLPEDFFKGLQFEQGERYIHRKAKDYVPIVKEEKSKGFNYQFILEKGFQHFILEAVVLEVAPGAQRKKVSTDAYEFKYVLEGELAYHIDDEVIHLQKGDSLLYDGRLPHVPHNLTQESARMLVVYLFNPGSESGK